MRASAHGLAGTQSPGGTADPAARRAAGPAWPAVIPALVTLAATLYQISHHSFWDDEAATLSATQRTLPQLLLLLRHVDAVHGAYYFLMWFVVRLAGTSELAARFPSAVAMAVAAGMITLLGRRLVSASAGVAAGLVFAAIPEVDYYGQTARSYAIVTALATIASYLLVRALVSGPRTRWRWLAGYGAAIAALGLANMFALLLVPAHGLTLAVAHRHGPRGGTPGTAARRLAAGWLVAVVAAGIVVSPVALLALGQTHQIHWIKRPSLATYAGLDQLTGPGAMGIAVLAAMVAGVAVAAATSRNRTGGQRPAGPIAPRPPGPIAPRPPGLIAPRSPGLITLCLPWLVLPAAILIGASYVHPVYDPRYIVFCIPAAALLAGAGLAALGRAAVMGRAAVVGRVAAPAALILIVALALPAQASVRQTGRQDMRAVSHFLARSSRPGDGVYYANPWLREIEIAYPAGFRGLRDVNGGTPAAVTGQLTVANIPFPADRKRLGAVSRVWVLDTSRRPAPLPSLGPLGFRWERTKTIRNYRIRLYVRIRPAP